MLEINKKEDIVIPFNSIGESGWEIKTREILEAIADDYDNDMEEPISLEEITQLEQRLGTTLPESLKLFYRSFGIADIGEELQELEDMSWLKDTWAKNPENGPDFTDEDKKHLPYLITFSDYLNNGNMFCFHSETKEIYYFDHDGEPYISKLFDSVDNYLKGCLIFAQNDFSTEPDIDEWTEEIVSDIVGSDVVQKWMY